MTKFFTLFIVLIMAAAANAQDVVDTPENVQLLLKKRDYSDSEINLLQELEERRIHLNRREQALELRERLVDMSESRLDEKIKNLADLQTSLQGMLKNLSGKEDEELLRLAKIYESMKPASAAEVLNKLDNAIVYDLFRRMKGKNTAKIMEKMTIEKARVISEMLAEKNDLPEF